MPRMPSSERVNWQPISQMPLVASMIDGALSDTADHLQALTKARAQPHVLDDATIDRMERVHREQLQFVDIYAEQLRRWRDQGPSAARRQELDRLEEKNRNLRRVTTEVLTLATELRKGTIDRIMAMSDLELCLQALLGTCRQAAPNPTLDIACNTLPCTFTRMGLPPRIGQVKADQKARGRYLGGSIPFGYRLDDVSAPSCSGCGF